MGHVHRFSLLVILLVLVWGAAAQQAVGQASGTYPDSPFNGLQITYSVSGATVTETKDEPGFTTSRSLKGNLGAGQLSVSGSAKATKPACKTEYGNFYTKIHVSVWAGDQKKEYSAPVPDECEKASESYSFSLAVPIPKDAKGGGFVIDETLVNPRFGNRGLVVSGQFGGGAKPTTEKKTSSPEARLAKLLQIYGQKIPKGLVSSGNLNNLLKWWDNKYSEFACGGYQGKVLAMLDELKWSDDAAQRELLNGYDYGPIQAYYGGHQAVVLYPKGTNWVETGIVLDPWPTQSPRYYAMADWAMRFGAGTYYGIGGSSTYEAKPEYPTVGGGYVNPKEKGLTPEEMAWGKSLSQGERDKLKKMSIATQNHWIKNAFQRRNLKTSLIAQCPLNVNLADEEGRTSGFPNGELKAEIPGVFVNRLPLADGTYWTELEYPPNKGHKVVMTGTGSGSATVFTGFNMDRDPSERSTYKYALPLSEGQGYELSQEEPGAPIRSGGVAIESAKAQPTDAQGSAGPTTATGSGAGTQPPSAASTSVTPTNQVVDETGQLNKDQITDLRHAILVLKLGNGLDLGVVFLAPASREEAIAKGDAYRQRMVAAGILQQQSGVLVYAGESRAYCRDKEFDKLVPLELVKQAWEETADVQGLPERAAAQVRKIREALLAKNQ